MTKITKTDAYKFPMAEAGVALRTETFYYSHRRGGYNGWHYMPVNPTAYIQSCLPKPAEEDYSYLREHQYEVGAAYRQAFKNCSVKVMGVPQGSWFHDREPAFSATGASAVVSWLEPQAIALQYRIQIATLLKSGASTKDVRLLFATCEREREIIQEAFDSLGVKMASIEVRSDEYYQAVLNRAKELVNVVKDPNRIFEVGMRAVSCLEQHEIALKAIKEAGILRTSNVYLAQKLGMIPVGTMGHEHLQRFGDDYEGYTAMRDRFPGFLFYLPDTFSTLRSGIPSALRVISETPERDAGIRFDTENGIRGHYTFTVARARELGLVPRLALESGWNLDLTVEFEELRELVRWPADRQAYGYGGYLVKPPWPTFARDDVSAIWKVSQSGSRATMKFGDEPNSAKASIPGCPVIWRPSPLELSSTTPASYIAQEGEKGPKIFRGKLVSGLEVDHHLSPIDYKQAPPVLSPETRKLVQQLELQRDEVLVRAALRGL